MPSTDQSKKQDIWILVMGATGAGKSFFINALLGEQKMLVGADLKSCTTEIGVGIIEDLPNPNCRINLIDTPGFDGDETDLAILTKIANCLKESQKKGAKIGGVIYLHDITASRFDAAARRNLAIFRKLCGDDVLDRAVLGTTKWGFNVPGSDERHRQLETVHWKPLIDKGAQVRRFDGSHKSALSFIDPTIADTSAGKWANQSAKHDIFILVMGATGAGKSFFINTLLGEPKMPVGTGLKSCTTEIGIGIIEGLPNWENCRLHLIDTPGFDTNEPDLELLTRITTWSQKKGVKIGGVIYLHDITASRFDAAARRNLGIIRSLYGEDSLDRVVLGTTKWGFNVPGSDERHRQLENTHWKLLIDKKAKVRRFDGTHASALDLIETITSAPIREPQAVLQIQKEMSSPNATVFDTTVGKYAATEKNTLKAALQQLVNLVLKSRVSMQS